MKIVYLFIFLFSLSLSAQSDYEKAEKLYNQKKYSESKVLFESYLEMHPKDYKTIEKLGDIAGQQKKWTEAIKQYKILKTAFPKNADYFYKYGGAMGMKAKTVSKFKAMGMLDDIENSFLTAAKLDSKHIDTRWALVVYYLEIPGILGGSEAKSQKYANELVAISAVDGYLANGYIAEYYKRYKIAEKQYLKANELGKSKITYQKLYDLYKNKLNQPEKAEIYKREI
jgi:tetratricopeptide (TPR) repeat protein